MEDALGIFHKCNYLPLLARAIGDCPWHYTMNLGEFPRGKTYKSVGSS